MTLGPKFFCCSKMAVTRRRSKLWWRKAHQSKALVELQRSRRSKRDLKPSGTHFFEKIGPCGHIKGALLQKKKSFSKICQKSILTGAKIRKKLRWIRICNPFCLKPSKMMSFWQFSFLTFFIVLHFSIFWGRRHEALAFKLLLINSFRWTLAHWRALYQKKL